jgi:DNA-binding response OmpR family regulator
VTEIEGLRAEIAKLWAAVARLQPDDPSVWLGLCHLTRSEFAILDLLYRTRGAVTRQRIRNRLDVLLAGRHTSRSPVSVDVRVGRLRRALAKADPPIVIETVSGFGYRLDDHNRALLAARRAKLEE